MPPPGLQAPPGLENYQAPPGLAEPESEPLTLAALSAPTKALDKAFSQLHMSKLSAAGPAPPPALAPTWAAGPAPPPAAPPAWVASSQPIANVGGQGAPLKVSLLHPCCPVHKLDHTLPAKKMVPTTYGNASVLHLDPALPAKKMISESLLKTSFNFLG